ncbi:MAG: hypothetical protein WCR46_08075 [Deltaproteobacteria bacterium]|jgi:DNA-binding NtrC family response regulator
MGMDLEIKVDTWERAIQKLETGEIDFLPKMSSMKDLASKVHQALEQE